MGASGKHGGPINFRCAHCRHIRALWPRGSAHNVVRTGREKGRSSYRSRDDVAVEYKCKDCGHVGWSTHWQLKNWSSPETA